MPDQVETMAAGPSGGIPNHPSWPALVIRGGAEAGEMERVFTENGWGGTWESSVFDYHHYHPASHEVLGVSRGEAVLHLGGPDGDEMRVEAGDVLVLPAGFGHKRVSSSADFAVVGAYPPGQESPEIARADADRIAQAMARIREVPRPGCPLGQGIVEDYWKS